MSDKKLYWQSAAHMLPENFIRLVVSHTQHDRLSSGIISKGERLNRSSASSSASFNPPQTDRLSKPI
jgi:hypothetical protein